MFACLQVCEGPMWDVCYARTFHVFDFETECPCVVYIATSKNEEPWVRHLASGIMDYPRSYLECAMDAFLSRWLIDLAPYNPRFNCSQSCNSDRDCAEYEWCAAKFGETR